MAIILYSCKDEGIVGENLFGKNRLDVNIINTDIHLAENPPFIEKEVSGIRYGMIGTYEDPVFGSTKAGTAFQLRILSNPNFADTMFFDSVKISLRYSSNYGNIDNPIKAKVFELDDEINFNNDYKQDFDISPLLGNEIGNVEFIKENVYDSIFYKSKGDNTKDSVDSNGKKVLKELINQLSIKLDDEFGEKLFYASPNYYKSGESFLDLLRGICILTENTTDKGAIYSFDLLSNSTFLETFYHYHSVDSAGDLDTINRTSKFYVTENSVTLNLFDHDRQGSTYAKVLNGTILNDSLYYLQGMAGSKLYFEIPDINSWKDSDNIVINEASIRFDIYGDSIYHTNYPLPSALKLNALNEENDPTNLTSQTLSLSNLRSFKYLEDDDQKYYLFLFALYLQDIINGEVINDGFELYVNNLAQFPRSVLLLNNNGTNKEHIKVKIIYTKVNN